MASGDLIEATLRDLSAGLGALPRHRRHRIVTEARDHLVQASADVGVEEAVRRFGAPGELAAMHVQTAARRAPRRAVVVLGAAGLAYGMVQAVCSPAVSGVFPPGPWPNDGSLMSRLGRWMSSPCSISRIPRLSTALRTASRTWPW